ncbi:elongation factor P 5-aminopentanone reductase [Peribacillus deserti]|uniref:3-oxoacyl-ACP reductase n=1 Tax=Peribacillus deserti TaxID=673318 RepID=A0A2N5MB76_9BACI|nr:SDR family oxidoreductase [Peribacillus deserti]PLT31612.1 3-oxoacyl-ACP reductase [Peribacillus deserti]
MEKYALITGASGGIGRSIAQKLASEGYSLYLHYHTNEKAVTELMAELDSFEIELIPIQADLSSKDGYLHLANNIFSLDAIVLNSGSSVYGLVTEMEEHTVQQMVQLHVTTPFLISKMLLPKLMNKKQAAIVAITSIWGQTGASYEVLYSMVKGAQNAYVKALSKELAPTGIRVNAIAPGAISTPMMEDFSPEDLLNLQAEIPMGRMGTPGEIAETAAFLLSDKASYMTGQILGVNGGWYT